MKFKDYCPIEPRVKTIQDMLWEKVNKEAFVIEWYENYKTRLERDKEAKMIIHKINKEVIKNVKKQSTRASLYMLYKSMCI